MDNVIYMKQCIEIARQSGDIQEIPVGSLLIQNNIILAKSHNTSINKNDPTAHAEINVIREACIKINNYRINNSVLFTTLEPCLMCIAAICEARIDQVFFGAYVNSELSIEEKFIYLKRNHNLDHTPKFIGGILQEECSLLIKNFFKNKRRQF